MFTWFKFSHAVRWWRACVSYLFFSPHLPRAALPLDCITCFAPVWLSLAGWWSFLAGYENQSDFLAPTFPHTLTCPTTTTIRLTVFTPSFLSRLQCFRPQGLQRQPGCLCQGEDEGTASSQLLLRRFCSTLLSWSQYRFSFHLCLFSPFLCLVAQPAVCGTRFELVSYSNDEEQTWVWNQLKLSQPVIICRFIAKLLWSPNKRRLKGFCAHLFCSDNYLH